jgi:hypothetical protein
MPRTVMSLSSLAGRSKRRAAKKSVMIARPAIPQKIA